MPLRSRVLLTLAALVFGLGATRARADTITQVSGQGGFTVQISELIVPFQTGTFGFNFSFDWDVTNQTLVPGTLAFSETPTIYNVGTGNIGPFTFALLAPGFINWTDGNGDTLQFGACFNSIGSCYWPTATPGQFITTADMDLISPPPLTGVPSGTVLNFCDSVNYDCAVTISQPTPEPTTASLLAIGMALLCLFAKFREISSRPNC